MGQVDFFDEHKYDIFISYSQLIGTDPDEMFIGVPMLAVLTTAGERVGSILDIEGFKLVG